MFKIWTLNFCSEGNPVKWSKVFIELHISPIIVDYPFLDLHYEKNKEH